MSAFFAYEPGSDTAPVGRVVFGTDNQYRDDLIAGRLLMLIDISDLETRDVEELTSMFPYEPTLAMRGRSFKVNLP